MNLQRSKLQSSRFVFRRPGLRSTKFAAYGDAMDIFSTLYNTVTICTAATGCFEPIDLTTPSDPDTHKLLALGKPGMILNGPAGRLEIAPYGLATEVSSELKAAGVSLGIGALAAIVGGILLIRAI